MSQIEFTPRNNGFCLTSFRLAQELVTVNGHIKQIPSGMVFVEPERRSYQDKKTGEWKNVNGWWPNGEMSDARGLFTAIVNQALEEGKLTLNYPATLPDGTVLSQAPATAAPPQPVVPTTKPFPGFNRK